MSHQQRRGSEDWPAARRWALFSTFPFLFVLAIAAVAKGSILTLSIAH